MRPVGLFLGILASIATILTYFHFDPPWLRDYFPHIAWPLDSRPPETVSNTENAQTPFFQQYENGLSAAKRHDFVMAVEFYASATKDAGATPQERVKAFDALGYAYFRMRDYDDADRAFASALAIDPNASTPRVNQIKVLCGRRRDLGDIQNALEQLRNSIAASAYETRNLETDKELFRICSYAGAAPRSVTR